VTFLVNVSGKALFIPEANSDLFLAMEGVKPRQNLKLTDILPVGMPTTGQSCD